MFRQHLPPANRRNRRRFTAAGILIGALTLTACSTASEAGTSAAPLSRTHIHGIGVDPTTGAAFVATHDGVFELPGQGAGSKPGAELDGPIAGIAQDTMGFVVDGDRMFASGHPAPGEREDLALPNLGLMMSENAANSWQMISLEGETDFHDIDVIRQASGRTTVYGLDAATGIVRVSQDSGVNWTDGATVDARDLAVDPLSPDTVYATTAQGLLVSRDNAMTFSLVDGAPALHLVDSLGASAGGLIGVDTDGAVWTRSAEGTPWLSRGVTRGEVQALTYAEFPIGKLIVADERGIVASETDGRTWQVVVAS
jgi:hypothetical protein